MLVVMAEVPYWARHSAREMTGTVTFLRLEGREELLSLRVPLDCNSVVSIRYVAVKRHVESFLASMDRAGATHHPATVSSVPAEGSDPWVGSVAYAIVELSERALARCQTATS